MKLLKKLYNINVNRLNVTILLISVCKPINDVKTTIFESIRQGTKVQTLSENLCETLAKNQFTLNKYTEIKSQGLV